MLRADGVSIAVAGRTLIDSLSLELRPGTIHALLGRNGTGKTSLMLALAGLRRAERGATWLGDTPLDRLPRLERARRLGVLLQDDPGPFWGSTEEYVALGRYPHGGPSPADAGPVRDVLGELGLEDHAGQPFRSLSGGERQRARIAQVLVQAPQVLLLDEPLRNLDPAHQGDVLAALRARACRGTALLVSLHEPALARWHCDQAVLLYDPARIEQGPVAEMLTPENLEALYRCRLESSTGILVPRKH